MPTCRLIAWEVTRTCNLACAHCRGSAKQGFYNNELDTAAAKRLIGQFKEAGNPLLIFTGGEPLLRFDIFELLAFARAQGLRCAVSTNGTLLNRQNVRKLALAGVSRCSISLDEPQASAHDTFRGQQGAFAAALCGIGHLKEAGVPFQINTTLTAQNRPRLPEMLKLCQELGAVAWHVFALLPVGRAANFEQEAQLEQEANWGASLNREDYANTLRWLQAQEQQSGLEIKPTCAPQYYCLETEDVSLKTNGAETARPPKIRPPKTRPPKTRQGCLGGINFCFVSHSGQVQPCGYLELDCGNVQVASFGEIWQNSPVLETLRQPDLYTGKCGQCPRRVVCGGCRVRALAAGQDFMGFDPLCFID